VTGTCHLSVILRPAGCHEPGGYAILPRRRPSFAPLRTSLGSTSLVLKEDGTVHHSEARHYPYGEERWHSGTLPTDYRFTGQRSDGYIKLTVMGARWYDGQLGRWISPDPIIPDPANPQSFNRYSYVGNRPLNRTDPSGHQEVVPELMQQAIDYFKGIGWELVGHASQINQYWNGADLVFTSGSGEKMRVLAIELKDVTGPVNLGTLGKSKIYDDYGGSIPRIVRSATRFAESSKEQLRLMSQAVLKGKELGTLENALFTSAKGVSEEASGISEQAQAQFEGAYRVLQDGKIRAIKDGIKAPGLLAKVSATASTAWSAARGWGTQLVTNLSNTSPSVPFIYVPYFLLDPMQDPSAPWYQEPVIN
jgi:RHS repeat-associated protein